MDRLGTFLRERTPRRALALASFFALVVLFRHLLPMIVLFVAFAAGLSTSSGWLARRARIRQSYSVLGIVALVVLVVGLSVMLGAGGLSRGIEQARDTFPERIAALRSLPLYQRFAGQFSATEELIEGTKHYARDVLHGAATVGRFLAQALVALVLAVIFVLERHELQTWRSRLDPGTLTATLVRWFEHVGDAITVTVQLQLVVAAFNTIFTLPLLFLLGIDHKLALMVLIFVSGLVPVVGNVVSGAVLSLLAYSARGWPGVAVFVVLTFVLHKIEAYYLNPRLTARHVALPGFLLVASLVAWEHLLGFAGLFVSFPVLFVAGRIRAELQKEGAEGSAQSGPV